MNRKVLLGLIIFALVVFYFLRQKSSSHIESENLASSNPQNSTASNSVKTRQPLEEKPSPLMISPSGKYGLRIPAQNTSQKNEVQLRDDYLKSNQAGLVLKSSDQNYILMKLRASKIKSQTDDQSLGHELFPIDIETARQVLVDENSYPVVFKESNGRIGLLTGLILIQTQNQNQADQLSEKYPMELQIYDPSIALASFKVNEGQGLYDVYSRIKQNEGIKSISFEVLDSYKGF